MICELMRESWVPTLGKFLIIIFLFTIKTIIFDFVVFRPLDLENQKSSMGRIFSRFFVFVSRSFWIEKMIFTIPYILFLFWELFYFLIFCCYLYSFFHILFWVIFLWLFLSFISISSWLIFLVQLYCYVLLLVGIIWWISRYFCLYWCLSGSVAWS